MTPEQLLARKGYIGASEAAAACGLSPWTTPFELWSEKTSNGPPEDRDSVRMEWGRRLESVVLAKYREGLEAPALLEAPCPTISSSEYPWMTATPDGLLPDRVVEIKTAGIGQARDWGEPGTDAVPLPYLLQTTHQMIVCEKRKADIPVLIGGSDYRLYTIDLDDELAALLISRERAFWQHVQDGTPPDVVTLKDAGLRWPKDTGTTVVATPEVAEAIAKLHHIEGMIETFEADRDALQLAVKTTMADASTLTDGAGSTLATWKAQVRGQFDFAAFKAAHPDLHKQFSKPQQTRVFRLSRSKQF